MTAWEIREINLQEYLADDGIPEWIDEDAHLCDYDHEWTLYYAEAHEIEEYANLRSIGLTPTEAKRVITHE